MSRSENTDRPTDDEDNFTWLVHYDRKGKPVAAYKIYESDVAAVPSLDQLRREARNQRRQRRSR